VPCMILIYTDIDGKMRLRDFDRNRRDCEGYTLTKASELGIKEVQRQLVVSRDKRRWSDHHSMQINCIFLL
jgi:hypothetical protein